MREREAGEITVQSAWRALRRRIRVVLICLVLCPAAAIAFSLLQMKEYSATASLLFRDPQFDQQVFGSSYVESYKDPTREAATNVELVSLDEVADKTAKRVRRGFTGKSVLDAVEIKPEGQSDVVSLTATSRSPQLAAKLARAFAGEFVRFRRDADRAKIREAQALVRRDIRRSRGTPRSRRSLSERLDQLGVLASLQTGNAEVVQQPEVPRE